MPTTSTRTALCCFSAPPKALVPLTTATCNKSHRPQTQLFSHPQTKLHYVHLDGCLFRVQAWRDRWRIDIGEGCDGPLIKLNARKLWELDPNEPLLVVMPAMA